MKKTVFVMLLAVLTLGASVLRSQDKAKPSEGSKTADWSAQQVTPLRVQVVFTEYDGEKKISSLPYTLLVNADDKGPQAAVRMGLRVPVVTGGSANANRQFQYMDVGTSLDGRADRTEDGRFNLRLNVEKSSLYTPATTEKPDTVAGSEILPGQPILQQFRSQVNLLIRDGQTMQATVASDPVTGHVLKVEVTVNVIK
ncbi:MAG TPA: hypothetical protein VE077_15015 [Candidatus Methylomirabilis sp.]|nr:hypothetical protein [Candidatus Methylomirabilis sp.]